MFDLLGTMGLLSSPAFFLAEGEAAGGSFDAFAPENIAATLAEDNPGMTFDDEEEDGQDEAPVVPDATQEDGKDAAEKETARAESVTDTDNPNETETPDDLLGFKTPADVAKSYRELQSKFGEQGTLVGTLRKQLDELAARVPAANPETPDTPKLGPNGFPLDDLGVQKIPDSYWETKRYNEFYSEAFEETDGDEAEAARIAGIRTFNDRLAWEREYAQERQGKQQEFSRAEQTELQALAVQQKARILEVQAELPKGLARIIPADRAEAATEELIKRGGSLMVQALEAGIITRKQAHSPEMVNEAVGEALKRMYVNGELFEFLGKFREAPGTPAGTGESVPPLAAGTKPNAPKPAKPAGAKDPLVNHPRYAEFLALSRSMNITTAQAKADIEEAE